MRLPVSTASRDWETKPVATNNESLITNHYSLLATHYSPLTAHEDSTMLEFRRRQYKRGNQPQLIGKRRGVVAVNVRILRLFADDGFVLGQKFAGQNGVLGEGDGEFQAGGFFGQHGLGSRLVETGKNPQRNDRVRIELH